jgi:hypothetical protein
MKVPMLIRNLATAVFLFCFASLAGAQRVAPAKKMSHSVFFTLKDKSAAARANLIAACRQYLSGHPGEVFFAAGAIAGDLSRDVNDRDFDVSLHIVFRTRADHDLYQAAEKHKRFVAENSASWARVRVFDSYLE